MDSARFPLCFVWYKRLMPRLSRLLIILLVRSLRSRRHLLLETLVLRQQLSVLARRGPRPMFSSIDRFLWVTLRRVRSRWQRSLILVQPETVVGWHRAGFMLYWTWLSRHRKHAGRRCVGRELCELIFRVVAENRTWGATRIHGELKIPSRVSCRAFCRALIAIRDHPEVLTRLVILPMAPK